MKLKTSTPIVLFCFTCVLGIYTQAQKEQDTTLKDGNQTLGLLYDNFDCGLRLAQASRKVTSRNTGLFSTAGGAGSGLPCALTISGIPSCYIVDKAYLWAVGSFGIPPNPGPATSQAFTIVNPSGVSTPGTMTRIGLGVDKCWTEAYSGTFRADVTAAITGNGVYTVNIPGLQAAEIDGITLMIIYKDVTTGCSFKGRVIIHDGIITVNTALGSASYTMNGISPCANVTAANIQAFAISSDLQLTLSGHTFNVAGASTSVTNSFYNVDIVNPPITTATSSLLYTVSPAATDCFSLMLVGLYYITPTSVACGGTCPNPYTPGASNTGPYCPGSSAFLSSSLAPVPVCAPTYSWSGPNSFTSTSQNPSFGPIGSSGVEAGTYTVTTSFPGTCLSPVNASTIVSTNGCLPVTFIDAYLSCTNEKHLKMVWSVESYENLDRFIIERSMDFEEWEEVTSLNVGEQSMQFQSFGVALPPKRGLVYYRLVERDLDGTELVLKNLSDDNCNSEEGALVIYPNPAAGDILVIDLNSNQEVDATVNVYDAGGKLVANWFGKLGECTIKLNDFSSGIYRVECVTGSWTKQAMVSRL